MSPVGGSGEVTNVRIDEVVATIAIVGKGFGIVKKDDVVSDLTRSIGATEKAGQKAIQLAVKTGYIVQDGEWLRLWPQASEEVLSKRIQEISRRLREYDKHKNDPYAYFPGEIPSVRNLYEAAPQDLDFLLKLLEFRSQQPHSKK